MKANEKDFLFILRLVSCIHFFYPAGPVGRSQSLCCNPSFFLWGVGGGVGDWLNALTTSTYA